MNLLIDAELFLNTDYVMPEGWWAIVGICAGIVLPLMVFAVVFLCSVLPRWRKLDKEPLQEAASGDAAGRGNLESNAKHGCVMETGMAASAGGFGEKEEVFVAMAEEEICVAVEDTETEDERLDRSFMARLILSDDDIKGWYSMIKNAALSYKGTKASMAWKQEKIRCGRKQIGKLLVRGKVLCLYLNLTMDDLKDCPVKYRVEDMSSKAINASTPVMYRIKNPLRARHAVDLIAIVAEKLGLKKAKRFTPVDYASQLKYRTEEQLIEENLIRMAPQTQYETFSADKK